MSDCLDCGVRVGGNDGEGVKCGSAPVELDSRQRAKCLGVPTCGGTVNVRARGSQGHRGLEKWRYMCTFTCTLVASEWMYGRSQILDL